MNALQRLHDKRLERWLGRWATQAAYQSVRSAATQTVRRLPRMSGRRHLLFALCDHYEPLWGRRPDEVGQRARSRLGRGLPARSRRVPRRRRPPPAPQLLLPRRGVPARATSTRSAGSRARGLGEVELHLHHDGDNAADARARSREYLGDVRRARPPVARPGRPGALRRSSTATGAWPTRGRDGRWCGVDDELPLLLRHRLLRRLHVPVGARRVPARHRQPDLLAGRRPRSRARATSTGERARVGADRATIAS